MTDQPGTTPYIWAREGDGTIRVQAARFIDADTLFREDEPEPPRYQVRKTRAERGYVDPPPEPLAPLSDERWSPADDAELGRLVRAGELWGPIARIFGKDAGECRNRWSTLKRRAEAVA